MFPSIPTAEQEGAFSSWLSMMRRCFLTGCESHSHYGARGITVCERWYDWRNFLADMGDRPGGLSLDRIDNSRGYSPDNCRWADATAQNRNTRANKFALVNGVPMLQVDAAKALGVSQPTLSRRMAAGSALVGRRPLKLVATEVEAIKKRIASGDSNKAIANDFSVSRQHICGIKNGRTWAHLK